MTGIDQGEAVQSIQLEGGVWQYDEARRLGTEGGFGDVFAGKGADGDVAVKRLKLTAGAAAFRELSIGSELAKRTLDHVVPVLDYGLDAGSDRYFIVMPRCGESLQAKLSQGPLPEDVAVQIGIQIVAGLREVGDLVHRDLKPANVLFHEGRWKIADFGIAKFVEDATSLQTLRGALTPAYGAPEQWQDERSSKATDVYALGCVMYALLTGKPPFSGAEDIRHAHLHQTPPELRAATPRLASLVSLMLRKAPEARPSLERCETVLSTISAAPVPPGARSALSAVAAHIAQTDAKAEAEAHALRATAANRVVLGNEARKDLKRMQQRLVAEIEHVADNVTHKNGHISLGQGHLLLGDADLVSLAGGQTRSFPQSGWDAAASSSISVMCGSQAGGHRYTWSCSLIYARQSESEGYRWYEIGFWSWTAPGDAPHSLAVRDPDFDIALSRIMGTENVAVGPWPIDGEDEGDFVDRWLWIFAKAAQGTLDRPGRLPVDFGFWQR